MGGFRVTERSMASNVLANLQANVSRGAKLQDQLSSGKLVKRVSDSPSAAIMSMQYRSDLAGLKQYGRNADDGMGWLDMADTAVTGMVSQVSRARDLVLTAMSSGTAGTPEAREAIAQEIGHVRDSLLSLANTTYLDGPVFGGTTSGRIAFNPNGTYAGDKGQVERTVSNNSKVRVDCRADDVFGTDDQQLFAVLDKIASDLRLNPSGLSDDLSKIDTSAKLLQGSLSSIGSRYNQLSQMQQAAQSRTLDLTSQLSDAEDIDLPKTITELSLQQTAYQAALAASAKVIQPSLLDFLR